MSPSEAAATVQTVPVSHLYLRGGGGCSDCPLSGQRQGGCSDLSPLRCGGGRGVRVSGCRLLLWRSLRLVIVDHHAVWRRGAAAAALWLCTPACAVRPALSDYLRARRPRRPPPRDAVTLLTARRQNIRARTRCRKSVPSTTRTPPTAATEDSLSTSDNGTTKSRLEEHISTRRLR